jgi:RNA polymerase sigma factor (sigma-70 family)
VKVAPWHTESVPAPSSLGLASAVLSADDGAHEPTQGMWRLEGAAESAKVSDPDPRAPPEPTEAVSAEQAFQLWRLRVWRFSSRLGVPHEALEDATQDVFTAVFRRWGDFNGLSTRRTWVLGFVPRVAAKYRRRHKRTQVQPSDLGPDSGVLSEPSGARELDPFESAARREATRIVQSFLDRLRDPDRELFVLVDLEGATVVEAAAVLEIKTRHAYKCLERTRRAWEASLVRHRATDRWRLR